MEKSEKKENSQSKNIKVNTTNCRNELNLIKILIKDNNWTESFQNDGDIFWSGLIDHKDYSQSEKFPINRIPGLDEVLEKESLAWIINKQNKLEGEDVKCIPKSFILPEDLKNFENYYENFKNKIIIMKPAKSSEGTGIKILSNLKEIKSYIKSFGKCIAQEYIDRPFLISGKKFDLRIFVMIAKIKPFIFFVNKNSLLRFCSENYENPDEKNLKNIYMHLTNTAINKNNNSSKESPEDAKESIKQDLDYLWNYLKSFNIDPEKVQQKIHKAIVDIMISLQPYIQMNFLSAFGCKETKNFQIVGFDILLDKNLDPWVLEINGLPSLRVEELDPMSKSIPELKINPLDFNTIIICCIFGLTYYFYFG